MPYQYRCPLKEELSKRNVKNQCQYCDSQGKFLTVLNHNNNKNKGIICPESGTKGILLNYEGISFENMPQEYLPALHKRKVKKTEEGGKKDE